MPKWVCYQTNPSEGATQMEITTVGLDLAKHVFQVHAVDAEGRVVMRKTLRRAQMMPFFQKLSRCLIGIEACGTSHYWPLSRPTANGPFCFGAIRCPIPTGGLRPVRLQHRDATIRRSPFGKVGPKLPVRYVAGNMLRCHWPPAMAPAHETCARETCARP